LFVFDDFSFFFLCCFFVIIFCCGYLTGASLDNLEEAISKLKGQINHVEEVTYAAVRDQVSAGSRGRQELDLSKKAIAVIFFSFPFFSFLVRFFSSCLVFYSSLPLHLLFCCPSLSFMQFLLVLGCHLLFYSIPFIYLVPFSVLFFDIVSHIFDCLLFSFYN
jgi:hypothetical protein